MGRILKSTGPGTAFGGTLTVILPSELAIEPPAGPMLFVVAGPFGTPTEVAPGMATVSPEGRRKKMPATVATIATIATVATIKTATMINRLFPAYEHSPSRSVFALTLPPCAWLERFAH